MPITTPTKRTVKGSPLTAAEGDGNLSSFQAFVDALEAQIAVSLNPDGTIKNPVLIKGVATGTSTSAPQTYVVATDGSYTSYAQMMGLIVAVKADVPSAGSTSDTTPPKLQVNGIASPPTIRKFGNQAVQPGDIRANEYSFFTYDGAFFQLLNPATTQRQNYIAGGGSANVITATIAALDTGETEFPKTLYDGYTVRVKIAATNTGAATLELICGSPSLTLGAKAVQKTSIIGGAGALVALAGGELQIGGIYEFTYLGTVFVVTNPERVCIYRQTAIAVPTVDGNLASAVTHGLGGNPDVVQWMLKAGSSSSGRGTWAEGDRIALSLALDSTGEDHAFLPFSLASNLQISLSCQVTGGVQLQDPAGAGLNTQTAANFSGSWTLEVFAARWLG